MICAGSATPAPLTRPGIDPSGSFRISTRRAPAEIAFDIAGQRSPLNQSLRGSQSEFRNKLDSRIVVRGGGRLPSLQQPGVPITVALGETLLSATEAEIQAAGGGCPPSRSWPTPVA